MIREITRAGLCLALVVGWALPVRADIWADLKKKMESAPTEVLFPDPQEKALSRIRYQPDQVIYLFRETQRHRHAGAGGAYLEQQLAEAVAGMHKRRCWRLTKQLRREHEAGKDKTWEQFREILAGIDIPEDLGAFVPVFERLDGAMAGDLQGYAGQAAEALQVLEDPTRLGLYVEAVAADPDFYTKRKALGRLWEKARKGIDGLIDRLEVRFSQENLIRFFSRFRKSRYPDELKGKASQVRTRLEERMVEAILEDFDDQVEGGIGGGLQSIMSGGGFIQTKTILLRGRLRILVKLMQELKQQPQELALFMPALKRIQQGIRGRLQRDDLDLEAKTYVRKVVETLDNTRVILGLIARKAGNAQPAEDTEASNLWRAVYEALSAQDFEGIFGEMKAHPESF